MEKSRCPPNVESRRGQRGRREALASEVEMSEHYTPRKTKLALRSGSLILSDDSPKVPSDLSDFQRRRLDAALYWTRIYLRGSAAMDEIGENIGVTHQRVTQIVQLGVDFLVSKGALRSTDG